MLRRPDFIQGFVESGHDVEAIEDMKRVRCFFFNDLEIGFPHIGADEPNPGGSIFTEEIEELAEAGLCPLFAYP